MVLFRPLSEVANYTTPIDGLFLTGARTHPEGAISEVPGRKCARVFPKQQHPLRERLAEVLKSISA